MGLEIKCKRIVEGEAKNLPDNAEIIKEERTLMIKQYYVVDITYTIPEETSHEGNN